MAYTIQINAGAQQTPAALGVMTARLTLVANGFNSLDLDVDAALDSAAVFAVGAKITLRDGATIRFVGEVIDDPRESTATDGPTHRYRVLCYLARLERYTFGQSTKVYFGSPAALGTVYDPQVTLGQDAAGTRCTAAAQIAAILTFASSVKSVPISFVSGTWPAGFQAPLDQRENCSCWEAIVCQLRWMPDHVLHVDYSSGAAVVKLLAAASLSAQSIAADGQILESARFTPRRDLTMSGLNIYFRSVETYDDAEREVRTFQTAGSQTDPREIFIDLEGAQTTTIAQKIEVTAYPSFDVEDYDGAVRAWIKARIPWLADLVDADWAITNIERSGEEEYAGELTAGAIVSWMGVGEEFETITFTVDYATLDADENYIDKATVKLPVSVRSTNATTKEYRKVDSYQAPEPEPTGLAAGIYAAWSILQWDGSFASDIDTIGWAIIPGARVSISGGPADWGTMAAIVQAFEVELFTGACSITAGTCRALEADSMTALYRALRGRRFAFKRAAENANAQAIAATQGPETFPETGSADSPAFARRFLRVSDTKDALVHDITIDPQALTWAVVGNKAAQDIKLREVIIPYIDAGTGNPVAKRSQALCGAPYGDAISIGTADGTATGQILYWNNTTKAWTVSTVSSLANGDLIKWDGSKFVNVVPAQITVLTDWRLDKSGHTFQVKSRTAYVISPSAESAWTSITDANGGILDTGVIP
jgi:hypothetical protein